VAHFIFWCESKATYQQIVLADANVRLISKLKWLTLDHERRSPASSVCFFTLHQKETEEKVEDMQTSSQIFDQRLLF